MTQCRYRRPKFNFVLAFRAEARKVIEVQNENNVILSIWFNLFSFLLFFFFESNCAIGIFIYQLSLSLSVLSLAIVTFIIFACVLFFSTFYLLLIVFFFSLSLFVSNKNNNLQWKFQRLMLYGDPARGKQIICANALFTINKEKRKNYDFCRIATSS